MLYYKILAIDDLLDNIHENIILLLENELIDLHDYTVTFKLQNAAGAETQLIDNQDFVKFYIDYKKFKFFNKDMRIFITFKDKIKWKKQVNKYL